MENLIEKEYWIYQERDVSFPWALLIVKRHPPRKNLLGDSYITATVYHEDIENAAHAETCDIRCKTFTQVADEIICHIVGHVEFEFTFEDAEQVTRELNEIFADK